MNTARIIQTGQIVTLVRVKEENLFLFNSDKNSNPVIDFDFCHYAPLSALAYNIEGVWRNFKGCFCFVSGLAIDQKTGVLYVIYFCHSNCSDICIRPFYDFFRKVEDLSKGTVDRFTRENFN